MKVLSHAYEVGVILRDTYDGAESILLLIGLNGVNVLAAIAECQEFLCLIAQFIDL